MGEVTSDQDGGLLGRTVHNRLGHARVLPAVAQLGVQDGQIPNRLLLHTGKGKRAGQGQVRVLRGSSGPCSEPADTGQGWCPLPRHDRVLSDSGSCLFSGRRNQRLPTQYHWGLNKFVTQDSQQWSKFMLHLRGAG